MASASTVGDIGIGICCCHVDPTCIPMVGIISTGSTNCLIANIPSARIGDIVVGGCGHVGILVSGCSDIQVNSRGKVGTGSSFAGCFSGVIVSGKSNIQIS